MQIVQGLEDGDAPKGRFVINMDQLVHVRVMLNELRIWREDRNLDTRDVDELLDDLPDFMIW